MSKKKVTLACEKCRSKNYVKNKTSDDRLIISKFCKKCVQNTSHKEEK